MNKYQKRLLKLADFLEKLPPRRFDYSCWVGEDWKGAQDLSCGTTACALGWAATMPEFRRLGLRLVNADGGYVEGEDRIEEIFGPGAEDLFLPAQSGLPETATPKQVAKLMRKWVKEQQK